MARQRKFGASATSLDYRVAGHRWDGLAKAAVSGEKEAYRCLLNEVRPWLAGFFRRRLDSSFVDDAVQDSMLALHTKLGTFDTSRPFMPWLTAIARHKWIDKLREIGAQRFVELEDKHEVESPETALVASLAVDRLLASLKKPQADAIRFHKLLGLNADDAARQTGQSPSLVRVNAHRGIAKLRSMMTEKIVLTKTVAPQPVLAAA